MAPEVTNVKLYTVLVIPASLKAHDTWMLR